MSGQKLLVIEPLLSIEVLCDFMLAIGMWHKYEIGQGN
jgi:hypothetical protein